MIATITYSIMGINYVCIVFVPVFGISATYTANTTNKILPLLDYYIYDVTKMPFYVLMYISQIITIFFAIMTYTGIDTFLGLLVFHIYGQMDILIVRFSCLSKVMKFRNGLKSCVISHIRTLRYYIYYFCSFSGMLTL